jgi:hypothetical protein
MFYENRLLSHPLEGADCDGLRSPDRTCAVAKDTAVVVHLEHTPVAHRAVVCSWWLWRYAFLTYAGCLGNEGALKQARTSDTSLYRIFSLFLSLASFFVFRVPVNTLQAHRR